MAANNQVVLIGRAGNNPADDIRYTQSGKAIAEVRLAVSRPGKGPDGQPVTDWLNCQFWDKNAERLSEFVKKGDLLSVAGSVRIDTWEKDGQKRQKLYIQGENFQMLESRQAREARQASEPQSAYDYQQQQASKPAAPPPAKPAGPAAHTPQYNDEFDLGDDELPPF